VNIIFLFYLINIWLRKYNKLNAVYLWVPLGLFEA
jgi:hypothetical protein